MTHRLHYIDNLKGVLILLVVLGHCIQCTDLDFDHNAVFRYIYSFHMPLFMCVSGFVSYKPDIKWQTVQKRFRQLIIPFLAWVAVSCCVHLDPTLFLAKVVHPDSGLWFLWTLFFIVLLMWLCNWIVTCLKVKIEYVVCFFSLLMMGIMVALKFKLFGFQFIAWYFPFYAIGFFGRKYQYLWEKRGRVDSLWFSALFLCMAYWWMRKDPPLFMPPSSHVVYAIHQTIITLLTSWFNIASLRLPYWLYVCCLWVMVSAISYLCYRLIERNRYLSLLFLGK